MATSYDIRTSTSADEITRAFDRAFTERPSFLKGLMSFSRATTLQRARKWQSVRPSEDGVVREYELATAGEVERIAFDKIGSISGSRIALMIEEYSDHRIATVYSPKYKTAYGGLMNQFSGDFKVFSKIILGNIQKHDSLARMQRS